MKIIRRLLLMRSMPASGAAGADRSVNGFQTIDGYGVNVNALSWNGERRSVFQSGRLGDPATHPGAIGGTVTVTTQKQQVRRIAFSACG